MAKEYIEREALLARLKPAEEDDDRCAVLMGDVRKILRDFAMSVPAADVVEVVRCRDCKRSGMYAFGFGDEEELACLDIEEDGFIRFATAVDPNGYCSNGERRNDEGNNAVR